MEKKSTKARRKLGLCLNNEMKKCESWNVSIARIEAKVRDGCRRILVEAKVHFG
jgi:hypothetical protein